MVWVFVVDGRTRAAAGWDGGGTVDQLRQPSPTVRLQAADEVSYGVLDRTYELHCDYQAMPATIMLQGGPGRAAAAGPVVVQQKVCKLRCWLGGTARR